MVTLPPSPPSPLFISTVSTLYFNLLPWLTAAAREEAVAAIAGTSARRMATAQRSWGIWGSSTRRGRWVDEERGSSKVVEEPGSPAMGEGEDERRSGEVVEE